jgi:hypothetical protein
VYECVRVNAEAANAVETAVGRDRPPRTWLRTRHALPLTVGVPLGWIAMAAIVRQWAAGELRFTWRPRRNLGTAMIVAGVILFVLLWAYFSITIIL